MLSEWDILDLFFQNHKYPFTSHHLDSYRELIKTHIPNIIKSYNPITMIKNDDFNNVIMKVDVFVGGEDGNEIYIDRPITYENGTPKLITPNDARLRNLTYETHLFAKVVVKITHDGNKVITKTFANVAIGSIPIMLHSDACVLNNQGSEILRQLGECPYDMGGYFIIDGKEKVIIAQEKIVTNRLFITKLKDDKNFEHKGIIRCVADNAAMAPRSVEFYIVKTPILGEAQEYDDEDVGEEFRSSKGAIYVSLPSFNGKIPLFILFRALGIVSDKDIYYTIFGTGMNAIEKSFFDNFIRPSVADAGYEFNKKFVPVFTQEDALNYLKFRVQYGTLEHVRTVLTTDVFPNMTEFSNKGKYLGYLTLQFIKTVKGILPLSDRDSYIFKRIDISGFMLSELFHEAYEKLRDSIRNIMDSMYYYGSWRQLQDYNNFITENNIYKMIPSMVVTETFSKSLKGRWGLASDEDPELGKVQDLSRISYIGFLSHLRRINMPLDRSIKITSPHRLHSQQWGMMCPFESPDGASIGYLKNLSLLTKITAGTNVEDIKQCLLDIGVIPLEDCHIYSNKKITNVFVNGSLYGITGDALLTSRLLKAYRRNGLINALISISWHIPTNEIRIFTEAGRPCRPVLILQRNTRGVNQVLAFKQKYDNWFDMLNGTTMKLKDDEKTDDYYYKSSYIDPHSLNLGKGTSGGYDDDNDNDELYEGVGGYDDEEDENDDDKQMREHRDKFKKILKILEKNSACIEYLDNEETDTCYIAMSQEEINPYHTHLEIHPSTIMSVVSGNIPLANHNQSARNVFHAAQSKQAIGMYATNFNKRFDTMSYVLHYPQRPIINTRIAQYTLSDYMPNGFNTVVAIMTYTGFNQEDSIMINKASVERGLNYLSYYKSVSATSKIVSQNERIIFGNPIRYRDRGIKVANIKHADYSLIDDNGYIKEGSYIAKGGKAVIIGMLNVKDVYKEVKKGVFIEQVKETIYTDISMTTDNSLFGIVDKVYISNKLAGEDSIICKVRFLKIKKPEFGDKHASRHGQKGVIGMIIPEENMPYTKDGVRPDIIINPHAIPSRMTIGHLVECAFAKLCCLEGLLGDGTVFIPFDEKVVYKGLDKLGFDSHGNEILYNGFTGKQIETQIFIGPTYYFRLKHMVAEKMNVRNVGAKVLLTRQPTEGRRKGGGLRIGEMERDSVLSHGVSLFMKESMMERSDKFKWCVCKRCGTLVSFNPVKDIGTCTHCKQDDIALVETPYAFKLLIQELEAMGIELRLNTEELTMPVEQLEIARDQNDNEDEEDIEYFDIEEENKIERRWEDSYDESFNTPVIKGGAITSSEADNDEALEQPVKGGQDAEDDEEDYEEDYEEEDDDDEDDDDEEDDEEDDDEEEDDNGDDGANGKIRGYTQGGENEDENDNAAETFDNNQNEMKVIEIE
jgi:DNA-directed RNA polymerase II subunit RPB2